MKLTDMNRDGCFISAQDQAKALCEWFDGPTLHYQGLAVIMNTINPYKRAWAHGRNADALVQKLRKAGVIEYISGAWYLSDSHADNIHDEVKSWPPQQ